jgi:single-strand DNA-binding protein
MVNEALISLSGYVATQPTQGETRTGVPTLRMRVAWTPRRLDRLTGEWVDADTSFATVHLYRKLAENARTCVCKGDAVVVQGRLTVRDWEDKNGGRRREVEIDATGIGPDLSRGVARFQRLRPLTGVTAAEFQDSGAGDIGDGAGAFAGSMGADSGPEGGADRDDMFDDDAIGRLADEAAGAPAPV